MPLLSQAATTPEGSTEMGEEAVTPTLEGLPVEIALHIFAFLENDLDIVRLAGVNSSLKGLARSDDVWRPRCVELWEKHGTGEGNPFNDESIQDFYSLWSGLFGPYKRHLGEYGLSHLVERLIDWSIGFFASSLPYNGRLIRFTLHQSTSDPDALLVDRFRILARELSVSNADMAEKRVLCCLV